MSVPPLTVKEAAARASVSVKTIRRAYESGALAHVRPAGVRKVLILEEDLDRWRAGETAAADVVAMPSRRSATSARSPSRRREEPGSLGRLRAIEEAAGR